MEDEGSTAGLRAGLGHETPASCAGARRDEQVDDYMSDAILAAIQQADKSTKKRKRDSRPCVKPKPAVQRTVRQRQQDSRAQGMAKTLDSTNKVPRVHLHSRFSYDNGPF